MTDDRKELWVVLAQDLTDKENLVCWSSGWTEDQALDQFLLNVVDDAQQTFGENSDEPDPETLEEVLCELNETHTALCQFNQCFNGDYFYTVTKVLVPNAAS